MIGRRPQGLGDIMTREIARMIATEQRLLVRSCESLLGMCAGFLADGHLSDEEILFLDTWLRDHQELTTTWPGEAVHQRVKAVLADGVISEDERQHLTETLAGLIGGTLQDSGATTGLSTRLPLDAVQQIEITERTFCFTGAFVFGTRAKCQLSVIERGGIVFPNVRKNLNYLVIGSLASRDWAHTSHGIKIEKAQKYKSDGCEIFVISEETWVAAL